MMKKPFYLGLLFFFLVGVFLVSGYTLVKLRKDQITSLSNSQVASTPVPRYQYVDSTQKKLTLEQRRAEASEGYSLKIVAKGRSLSFDPKQKIISILREDLNGSSREIEVDISSIRDVLCWPEYINGFDGTKIDVKQSYFPMTENSELYMINQETKPVEIITSVLTSGQSFYLIFHLIDQLNDVQKAPYVAKQMVVLGC